MRIWDIPSEELCRVHLLGEHRELHALWVVITQNKKGYAHHPETMRWRGKLRALYLRHEELVTEMNKRGYMHRSFLDKSYAKGKKVQDVFLLSVEGQRALLQTKHCQCCLRTLHT